MIDLRCLSLHQPWASLVAIGVKTIETRSWSTKHRGRIGIASTKRDADFIDIGVWHVGRLDPGVPRRMWRAGEKPLDLPLGALMATANLVDCVPIDRWAPCPHIGDFPHDGPLPHQQGGLWLIGPNAPNHGVPTRVEEQRPYGDFTPGRWAWLLDDVKATTERCPACWGYGGPLGSHADLTGSQLNDGGAEAAYVVTSWCPSCDGAGVCGPIPVKGHQGLWTWAP